MLRKLDLTFNKSEMTLSWSQKHPGRLLEECIILNEHIQSKMSKC